MKLVLKQVIISDTASPYNGLQKDIFIEDGVIASIDDELQIDNVTIVDKPGTIATPGWVDIFNHFCDPGYEHRETIETGAAAAAAGGFTTVFTLPNTTPTISGKSQVQYIVQRAKYLPVKVLPLGAITKNIEGKELAEIYDMYNSGAVAFTDGLQPVQTSGLLLKALQYVKAIEGVIVQMPVDKSIATFGLVNEGIISTQLGLPGIPEIAEELMIVRDIELARYTASRLHITGISTLQGVQLVHQAKLSGVAVSCSVTPYHLYFCDEDLATYDTNLKVDPPLRSRANMMGLRQALADGRIDCITSHHMPHDWDNKVREFEYAKAGMAGIETSFSVINSLFPNLSPTHLQQVMGGNARAIFKLPKANIVTGSAAEITLYNSTSPHTYQVANTKSKSTFNAFSDLPLSGSVVGIINKDQLYLNK